MNSKPDKLRLYGGAAVLTNEELEKTPARLSRPPVFVGGGGRATLPILFKAAADEGEKGLEQADGRIIATADKDIEDGTTKHINFVRPWRFRSELAPPFPALPRYGRV